MRTLVITFALLLCGTAQASFLTSEQAQDVTRTVLLPVQQLVSPTMKPLPLTDVGCHRLTTDRFRCRATVNGAHHARIKWHVWVSARGDDWFAWAVVRNVSNGSNANDR